MKKNIDRVALKASTIIAASSALAQASEAKKRLYVSSEKDHICAAARGEGFNCTSPRDQGQSAQQLHKFESGSMRLLPIAHSRTHTQTKVLS